MTPSPHKLQKRSHFLRSTLLGSLGVIVGLSLGACGSTKTVKPRTHQRFYKPRADRHKKRIKKVRMKG